MRDFDTMYTIYNDFQRQMERYWCLRWLQQEQAEWTNVPVRAIHESPLPELVVTAIVLRENLVKLTDIPLVFRAPSLPELPANTRVQLAIGEIDLLDLNVQTRFVATLDEEEAPAC